MGVDIHTHKIPLLSVATSGGSWVIWDEGGGPRVVVSTAAFHARVWGSVPGLRGLKETKMFLPHPRVKLIHVYCGEPSWPRGSVLGLRPLGLVFRILCLEDSVISFISPSSGGLAYMCTKVAQSPIQFNSYGTKWALPNNKRELCHTINESLLNNMYGSLDVHIMTVILYLKKSLVDRYSFQWLDLISRLWNYIAFLSIIHMTAIHKINRWDGVVWYISFEK